MASHRELEGISGGKSFYTRWMDRYEDVPPFFEHWTRGTSLNPVFASKCETGLATIPMVPVVR